MRQIILIIVLLFTSPLYAATKSLEKQPEIIEVKPLEYKVKNIEFKENVVTNDLNYQDNKYGLYK